MNPGATLDSAMGLLRGPWLYVAVGALSAAECAAMIGMVVPGETSMLLAGVAAGLGRASLPGVLTAAVGGAILGDQIGFTLGRWLGRPLRRGRLGRRIGRDRWARAEALIARRGGQAVFLARWVGILRAIVPAAAGAGGMERGVFTRWNAAGGALWATAVVAVGDLAGRSWGTVQQWLGTAGVAVGALIGLVLLGALATARRRGRRDGPERAEAGGATRRRRPEGARRT